MKKLFAVLLILSVFLSACGGDEAYQQKIEVEQLEEGIDPDSDSKYSFSTTAKMPVDTGIYELNCVIEGEREPDSLVKQNTPASGSAVIYGAYGSASYSGATYDGASFPRCRLLNRVETQIAGTFNPNEGVIIKVRDTKGMAIYVGDVVTFYCRMQAENVAAMVKFESFDWEKYGTPEFDYCRLADGGRYTPLATPTPVE